VNGIPRRAPEVLNGSSASRPTWSASRRSRPSPSHVPVPLCDLAGYWCFWHGPQRLLGRLPCTCAEHVSGPAALHPSGVRFTRSASSRAARGLSSRRRTVPNGGKNLPQDPFLEGLDGSPRRQAEGKGSCSAATERGRRSATSIPKAAQSGPESHHPAGARAVAKILSRGLVDLGRKFAPTTTALHLVGAWRNLSRAQIGWRNRLCCSPALGLRRERPPAPGSGSSAPAPRSLQAVFTRRRPPTTPRPTRAATVVAASSPAQIRSCSAVPRTPGGDAHSQPFRPSYEKL